MVSSIENGGGEKQACLGRTQRGVLEIQVSPNVYLIIKKFISGYRQLKKMKLVEGGVLEDLYLI